MNRQLLSVSAAALGAMLLWAGPGLAQTKDATGSKPEPAKAEQPKAPEGKPTEQAAKLVHVRMSTSAGDLVLELNETLAPVTVKNFLAYVDKGFYNGTIFHRVMANFMIQGGGFTTDWKQKPTDPKIKNEWRNSLKNVRGTIAMARIGGDPDSATSQFFINVQDNAGLDRQQPDGAAYCVFGRVVDGMETVEKIRAGKVVGQPLNGEPSKPVEPVVIKDVKRLTPDEAAKLQKRGAGGGAGEKPKDEKKDEKGK